MTEVVSHFEYNIDKARRLLIVKRVHEIRQHLIKGLDEDIPAEEVEEIIRETVSEITNQDIQVILNDINENRPGLLRGKNLVRNFINNDDNITMLKSRLLERIVFRIRTFLSRRLSKEMLEKIKERLSEHILITSETFQEQALVLAVVAYEYYLKEKLLFELYKEDQERFITELKKSEKTFYEFKYFKKNYSQLEKENGVKLNLDQYEDKYEDIRKIIGVRNIILHCGGNIDEANGHLAFGEGSPWIGKRITEFFKAEKDYITNAINSLDSFVREFEKDVNEAII